jgi:hypothetical protein
LVAALGTMILSLIGRWIGGVWTTLLATLAAFLIGYQPLIGASIFAGFKTDLLRRILIAAVPFTIGLIGLSIKSVPNWARILFALAAPAIMLDFVFLHFDISVPRQDLLIHKILPVAAVIFAAWMLVEPIAARSPGAAAPIVVGAVTGGVAFLLLLSSENQAGQMAPLVQATAGGAVLAAMIASAVRKKISFARGPVLLWFTLTGALFAFMWLDTDQLPAPFLLMIAIAPLLAWIPEIGPLHRWRPWKRESLRFGLVMIPVAIAMVLAFRQHKAEAAASGDEYGFIPPPRSFPAILRSPARSSRRRSPEQPFSAAVFS